MSSTASTSASGLQRRPAKTPATRRALRKFEAKVIENPKRVLLLRGATANEVVADALADLAAITKPYCKKLKKRNAFLPFDGREHLEFLGFKNDCSLFCFGSHSKKRPNNLTIGRHFDFHVLDMLELGIVAADRLDLARVHGVDAASVGGKPFFVFEGSEFSSEPAFVRLKSLLVDFFRGGNDEAIDLDGCDRVLFFSLRSRNGSDACVAPSTDCHGNKPPSERGNAVLCMRHYAVHKPPVAASGGGVGVVGATGGLNATTLKNITLYDIGPNFDLELRRVSFAAPHDYKVACRLPRQTLAALRSTAENAQADAMNNLKGQLHVGKQDVTALNLRRFKAHRRTRAATDGGDEGDNAATTVATATAAADDEGGEATATARRHRKRARHGDAADDARPETDI